MKRYERKTVSVNELAGITCDVCLAYFDAPLDMQNCVQLNETESYGSIFGDGASIECNICPHCLKDKLGQWLRVTQQEGRC
ncbi:hypothetical protein HCU74_04805 [Spongiibacter sp. KMU-166]|uniref:Uncharacterized protein n=1 Tax=Spongiibacter thalassae TaxID=2721624 RepID=A0ABX1GC48_9GAMM|nr:hypothetical protein [Spongiibacter thalassae]NKI16739.1 hypothetical protein [Spongiibacter thalassae]